MKHLVIDISGHGLGHLAQVAPVIAHLSSVAAETRLTIRSSLSKKLLRSWIKASFHYIEADLDCGMLMHDAITVDIEASCAWYENFHGNYKERLKKNVRALQALRPDLLLVDVPYISLEAAQHLGIPSVALCSLNWADIYHHYCHEYSACDEITERILSAYAGADCFLQPQPAMPMPELGNTRKIPPIARKGTANRQFMSSLEETRDSKKYILLSVGGIGMQFSEHSLPVLQNTTWIVPDSFETARQDVIAQSSLGMQFIDLLDSVALVLTKTGYGTLVEAVVNRVPVLCIERPGWPEEPGLFSWCRKHGYFEKTTLQESGRPATAESIMHLMNTEWEKESVIADGDQHAAQALSSYLHRA